MSAWLHDQGFSGNAEGTLLALLVRVEQGGLVEAASARCQRGGRWRMP
ncbi:hypothetical protein OUY22_35620 [Nonomuraea sp. MCN248]|uniref:Uncharacterized protein n=1 Tax=Nonomuraea corallina TaxID=2989783 RepID=A0ABT4SNG9_9ACTN|nr:hypothetical protein [Nonomuraea corallina]MDA0638769.1 hypothetical protein [Nonomuraea corallina]